MTLFRKEAVQHSERRIEGEVNLAIPLSSRLIAGVLAVCVVVALTGAAVFPYSRKEMVVGVIIPQAGLARVVSPSPGRIERLIVREGQTVRRGEPIMEVGSPGTIRSGVSGMMDVEAAAAQSLDREFEATERRSLSERETLRADQARLTALLAAQDVQIAAADRRIVGRRQAVSLAKADLERIDQLLTRGFAPERERAIRATAMIQAEADLDDAESARMTLIGQIAQTRSLIEAGRQSELRRQAELDGFRAQYGQRQVELRSGRGWLVTSPVDGTIATVPVTLGQSVSPDQVVAIVVPTGGRLEAELYVPVRSVGMLRPGQNVRLQYDAYPHQRFGTGESVVVSISGAPLARGSLPYAPPSPEPVYRVRATLKTTTVRAYGQAAAVRPGMTLRASIVTARRSLLQWATDPLRAAGRDL
ncbi:HlyD family secretion protein [Brevundimonas sp.]|uniref:HlyD family secretion protein n=1 Tax=Brevundimonas sp. TaxID=1871086 RepID=UPI002737DB1C|nr:HlyD family efflux transporter periplasmic adaptor subunit [Brevundimonas sp.]MDP3803486.1 HlyD family efflux transporter periplasmic adaptor subunit [Brevundimonas sp.]